MFRTKYTRAFENLLWDQYDHRVITYPDIKANLFLKWEGILMPSACTATACRRYHKHVKQPMAKLALLSGSATSRWWYGPLLYYLVSSGPRFVIFVNVSSGVGCHMMWTGYQTNSYQWYMLNLIKLYARSLAVTISRYTLYLLLYSHFCTPTWGCPCSQSRIVVVCVILCLSWPLYNVTRT